MSVTTDPSRLGDAGAREPSLRDAAANLARAAARRIASLRDDLRARRAERDVEDLVDRLEQLNDRQLAALGLNRAGLYGQIEARLDALRGDRETAWTI